MDYEIIWSKLCAEFSECSDEIQTGTGLWYKVSGDGKSLLIDNAVKNQPSCRLSKERKLSKKDFMFVSSYYERWLSGEKGVRYEVSRKSRNTAYVFGLLEGNLILEEGMDELIFILAPEENLKVVGVDTTYLRKSLDGKNAIIHIEFLTDEKLIKLIRLGKCMSLKNEWLENIIRSKEWETGDEII